METLSHFMKYAADFEKTLADDDWSRLRQYFADDAVYEVKSDSLGCKLTGPDAIFKGIKKSLDGFDRKFEGRSMDITSGPEVAGETKDLAAGVLGTVSLLFKNRDQFKTLPQISDRLGEMVRTNGESLLGATSFDQQRDFSKGIAIGSALQINDSIKIEPVRYNSGSSAMRVFAVPLTGSGNRIVRPLKLMLNLIFKFPQFVRL